MLVQKTPLKHENYYFKRNKIRDLKSGYNHIVFLSGSKVFTWGNNDYGALGTVFRPKIEEKKLEKVMSINLKTCK